MFSQIGYWICVPFAWLVRLFYSLTGSYGMALILFTLVIKLVLLPFQMKSKKSMMRMSRMSGRMQDLQKQYKNNQQKYAEEVQKMYAEEGVNPMGGCLWSFLPMPILIALYAIIRQPITHFMMLSQDVLRKIFETVAATGLDMEKIGTITDGALRMGPYGEINLLNAVNAMPDYASTIQGWIGMDFHFLGIDLAALPTEAFSNFTFTWPVIGLILIPIVSGVLSMLLSKISMSSQTVADESAARTNKMMMYFMPLFSVWIGFTLPGALGVYWIAQSAFSVIQEFFLGKFYTKKLQAEEDAREEQRAEARRLRMEEHKKQAALQKERDTEIRDAKKIAAKRAAKQEQKANQKPKTNENGRIGDRPYARGRTFSEEHYSD